MFLPYDAGAPFGLGAERQDDRVHLRGGAGRERESEDQPQLRLPRQAVLEGEHRIAHVLDRHRGGEPAEPV